MPFVFDFNQVLAFGSETDARSVSKQVTILQLAPIVGPTIFINQELLQFIESTKVPASILSASVFLLKNKTVLAHINPCFDQIFLTKDMRLAKDLPATYMSIADKLNCLPSDIVFVDDQWRNVEAANQAGCSGVVFTSNHQVLPRLTSLIQSA